MIYNRFSLFYFIITPCLFAGADIYLCLLYPLFLLVRMNICNSLQLPTLCCPCRAHCVATFTYPRRCLGLNYTALSGQNALLPRESFREVFIKYRFISCFYSITPHDAIVREQYRTKGLKG